jgi:DNA-binding protein YbaB
MFDKIAQAQQMAGEIKKKLDNISVRSEVEGGKICVVSTANKAISAIEIDTNFLKTVEKEELEDLLLIAVNRALEQAENVSQAEMQAATRNMFGDLGGMFGK